MEGWAAGVAMCGLGHASAILPSHVGASSCTAAWCLVLGRCWAMLVGPLNDRVPGLAGVPSAVLCEVDGSAYRGPGVWAGLSEQ